MLFTPIQVVHRQFQGTHKTNISNILHAGIVIDDSSKIFAEAAEKAFAAPLAFTISFLCILYFLLGLLFIQYSRFQKYRIEIPINNLTAYLKRMEDWRDE